MGAKILWTLDPPFERVYEDLGIDTVPGFEPGCIMDQVIDLYRPRFGAFQHWILKLLAHVKTLAEMRSGTVVVRLGGRAR